MRVTSDVMTEPLVALDPAWPKMSMADATAVLTAPRRAVRDGDGDDHRTASRRAFGKIPPMIWASFSTCRAPAGARPFSTILDDDRVSFEAN